MRSIGILIAAGGMALIRASVGFLTFQLLFYLRATYGLGSLGIAVVGGALGSVLGNLAAPALRRRVTEELMLIGSLGADRRHRPVRRARRRARLGGRAVVRRSTPRRRSGGWRSSRSSSATRPTPTRAGCSPSTRPASSCRGCSPAWSPCCSPCPVRSASWSSGCSACSPVRTRRLEVVQAGSRSADAHRPPPFARNCPLPPHAHDRGARQTAAHRRSRSRLCDAARRTRRRHDDPTDHSHTRLTPLPPPKPGQTAPLSGRAPQSSVQQSSVRGRGGRSRGRGRRARQAVGSASGRANRPPMAVSPTRSTTPAMNVLPRWTCSWVSFSPSRRSM